METVKKEIICKIRIIKRESLEEYESPIIGYEVFVPLNGWIGYFMEAENWTIADIKATIKERFHINNEIKIEW